MKKGDPAEEHREAMKQLHALFSKKAQYHKQKAFLEFKDIYWLVHEFFSTFLGKNVHFTEEELMKELAAFKHDYISVHPEVTKRWHTFFLKLSEGQYSGMEASQPELQALLQEFTALVDDTIGKEYAPADDFTKAVQSAKIFVTHKELAKAEQAYKKLVELYNALSVEQKRQHYEQLEKLYESIAALRSA
jgi:hypothetical protein